MKSIQCFRHDQWLDLTPAELEPGDKFHHEGKLLIVTGDPVCRDGRWSVPVGEPQPQPIQVDLSDGILARVMDFVGTSVTVFPDGTAILADLEWAPGFVYSPRLPKAELESFCLANRHRYKAFYEANRDAILDGESVAMEPWWLSDTPAELLV